MSEKTGTQETKHESAGRRSAPTAEKVGWFPAALSPADSVFFLQRTIGNQAVQRLLKAGPIQAKHKIGKPNDVCEQEADRVADEVLRMPEPAVRMKPG